MGGEMWGHVAHVEKCLHFLKENPKGNKPLADL